MSSVRALARGTSVFCAILLATGLTLPAHASDQQSDTRQYGDALLSCKDWTRLSRDKQLMKKPWSGNVFYRYASWTSGYVSGASAVNPALRATSAADIIKYVSDYCVTHPEDTIEQASAAKVSTLKP